MNLKGRYSSLGGAGANIMNNELQNIPPAGYKEKQNGGYFIPKEFSPSSRLDHYERKDVIGLKKNKYGTVIHEKDHYAGQQINRK